MHSTKVEFRWLVALLPSECCVHLIREYHYFIFCILMNAIAFGNVFAKFSIASFIILDVPKKRTDGQNMFFHDTHVLHIHRMTICAFEFFLSSTAGNVNLVKWFSFCGISHDVVDMFRHLFWLNISVFALVLCTLAYRFPIRTLWWTDYIP